jgi:WD40 repeat protein
MAGMVHAQGLKIRRDRKKPYDREFLKIWEAATGSEVYSERRFPVGEAAFAPDGNRYIVQNGRSLEMRDLETHKRIYSIKNAVFDGFTSDNQFILTESRDSKIYDNSKSGPAVYLDTLLPDRRNYLVEVRRVVDGSIQHLIKGTIFADNVDRPGYLSPDGRHVITHQWSGAVSIWNVASGKALPGLEEVVPNAADATFSNSGKYVAVAARENHLQVFRFPSATPVRSLLFQMDVNETVWGLAFSADDQYVALQTTSCIRVWSVETAALVLDVKRSRAGFAFSPVKNELVIVSPSKFNMLVCEFLRRARR